MLWFDGYDKFDVSFGPLEFEHRLRHFFRLRKYALPPPTTHQPPHNKHPHCEATPWQKFSRAARDPKGEGQRSLNWLLRHLRPCFTPSATVQIQMVKSSSHHPPTSKKYRNSWLTLKMVKMTLSEGQILTQNFDFRGHISTFQAVNTTKREPFKTENNSRTTSGLLQTNFQKHQKTVFLTLKMVKWPSQRVKCWRKFWF